MDQITALDALIDLYESTVKLLARQAVISQLIAAILAIFLAWLIAGFVTKFFDRWHTRWLSRQTRVGPDGTLVPIPEEELRGSKRLVRLFFAIDQQVWFPLLAILFLFIVRVIFIQQGWFAGLLENIGNLMWVFLAYRLVVGFLYAFASPKKAEKYHHQLLAPLAGTVLFLLIVDSIADLNRLAGAGLFPLFGSTLTLGGVFVAVIGLYLWFVATGAVQDLLEALIGARGTANPGSVKATLTLLRYVFIALGVVVVFGFLGFNATAMAAITGGLSIGVGFALQDVLKNFIGGIIMLFEGSVRPGDWVEISGTEGQVDSISIRSTIVRTFDNVEYIVPNQDWLTTTVTTFTRNNRRARARVPIGVSYDSDVRQVQQLLVGTALQHPDVLKDPAPVAPLVNYGDSSVDFVVLAWVEDAMNRGKVAAELRLMIWDAFKEHGIEIPFPQRDLHIRSGLAPALPEQAQNGDQADWVVAKTEVK